MWSVQGAWSVESQFWTTVCEEKTWAREADETPLLEAVARERLLKAQLAGKC
jgi:hypothetical protein